MLLLLLELCFNLALFMFQVFFCLGGKKVTKKHCSHKKDSCFKPWKKTPTFSPISDNDALRAAVNLYIANQDEAVGQYGPISEWDTSQVTSVNSLAKRESTFNADVSKWDMSGVVDFTYMFYYASSFNSNLSKWNVSSGIDFKMMLNSVQNFNSDLSGWDVSRATDLSYMFGYLDVFNGDLSKWDVSRNKYFDGMFNNAYEFNSNISKWNVAGSVDFYDMFYYSESFNINLCEWNIDTTSYAFQGTNMFDSSGCPNENNPTASNVCHSCN